MRVTTHEHTWRRRLPVRAALQRAALGQRQAQTVQQRHVLNAVEPDRQQDHVRRDRLYVVRDRRYDARARLRVALDAYLLQLDRPHVPVDADETRDRDGETAFA